MAPLWLIVVCLHFHGMLCVIIEDPKDENTIYTVEEKSSGLKFDVKFKYESGESIQNNPPYWTKCSLNLNKCKPESQAVWEEDDGQGHYKYNHKVDKDNPTRYTSFIKWRYDVFSIDMGIFRFNIEGSSAYRLFTVEVIVIPELDILFWNKNLYSDSKGGEYANEDQELDIFSSNSNIYSERKGGEYVNEDQENTVTCLAQWIYPEPDFKMFFGDIELKGLKTTKYQQKNYLYIEVEKTDFVVSMEDQGKVLKCVATQRNKTGVLSESTRNQTPIIYYKARFLGCPKNFTMQLNEEEARLNCTFIRLPAPITVLWSKKASGTMTTDTKIRSNRDGDNTLRVLAEHTNEENVNYTTASLTFYHVKPEQSGQYVLRVRNKAGKSTFSISVNVLLNSASYRKGSILVGFLCIILPITLPQLRIH